MDNSTGTTGKEQALDERSLLPPVASLTYDTLAMIFDSIDFEHISGNPNIPGTEKTSHAQQLYYLALTCKAFSDPALDALWKSITSILPLLQILPVFNECGRMAFDGCMLKRKVESEDLKRFRAYSQRIRILTLTDTSALMVGTLVLRMHNKHFMPLLPKLQRIHFSSAKLLTAPSAPFLFSDSLRHFELETSEGVDNAWIQLVLYTLQFMTPDLQHLILPSVPEGTVQEVLSFGNLCSLKVSGPLSVSSFRKLAILPGIRTLAVDVEADEAKWSESHRECPREITLISLDTLCIAGHYTIILALLEEMCGSHLKHVDATMFDGLSPIPKKGIRGTYHD